MQPILRETPHHLFTLEEYFALEQVSDKQFEYWDGKIVCVNGTSRVHAIVCNNLLSLLAEQLDKRHHRIFSGNLPIKTPTLPPYRHPDVSVACSAMEFETTNDLAMLTNPILVAEVLSPATEAADRQEKRLAYQALPSVMEYLLVSPNLPHITLYSRQGDLWERHDFGHLTAVVELPSINCEFTLAEIYQDIEFD